MRYNFMGFREQGTGNREQGTGSREQGAGSSMKELGGFFGVMRNQQDCS
ncbi:MAG: hypothetical protein F6J94_29920 [Moorea sp. SIO1F2]|nr:hypothetical protein [Moorena sp. SIO1F2]NET85954.1 hypothetical protein [Moorena sp. SIO1F2]